MALPQPPTRRSPGSSSTPNEHEGRRTLKFSAGGMRVEHEISEDAPLTFEIGEALITFMVTAGGVVLLRSSLPFATVSNDIRKGCEMELVPAPFEIPQEGE